MIPSSLRLITLITLTIAIFLANAEARDASERYPIGVNYGTLGYDLPNPTAVVSLFRSRNIGRIRLFNPKPNALRALNGSGIEVVLGTMNQDLKMLAANRSAADEWVAINVARHAGGVRFRYITAGNEVIPGDLAGYVLPAMENLDDAVRAAGLSIPVTTVVSTEVLGYSWPPSNGSFSDESAPAMTSIAAFLQSKNSPLLINVYPYFAYVANTLSIELGYALFSENIRAIPDPPYKYSNLFDAIVDAMYSAMERVGGANVTLAASETGWPSDGGGYATVRYARTYHNNLIRHVKSSAGTPRRPGREMEVYLFAMFNENAKPAGVERNFGLYHPNMTEVYHVEL